ncbi:MAG: MipA/OmpV family protein [Gammaproteobacteria bacterium]|nr:MAG: MipA/OmpV family protein [Gammaproteobacteria bacterium]
MRTSFLLILGFLCSYSVADEVIDKKWELGVGVGDIYGPDYRGSDEYRNYLAPIPYVIYRGKYIQSDRDGLRGKLFKSDRYELTFSAAATIVPKADENKAREGMPTLGSTVEIGPALNIKLLENNSNNNLILQIPLHAVIAVNGGERGYNGLVFEPQFIYRDNLKNWQFTQRLGVIFADEKYHDYYYSVDQQFVTPGRDYFDAHGGYSGVFTQAAISRSLQINSADTKIAFFLRYENLGNAAFAESSLVKTNTVLRGGFAFIWVIK